jgi:hypothetical protein
VDVRLERPVVPVGPVVGVTSSFGSVVVVRGVLVAGAAVGVVSLGRVVVLMVVVVVGVVVDEVVGAEVDGSVVVVVSVGSWSACVRTTILRTTTR